MPVLVERLLCIRGPAEVAWEPLHEAPAQTKSEALLCCRAQLIRMTKSPDEGPHVEAIMEPGLLCWSRNGGSARFLSSPLHAAEA